MYPKDPKKPKKEATPSPLISGGYTMMIGLTMFGILCVQSLSKSLCVVDRGVGSVVEHWSSI